MDTNVMVAAHRSELVRHRAALTALTTLAGGLEPWGVPVFCLAEFHRVVTHPKVFHPPTDIDAALLFIRALLGAQNVRLLSPGSRFPALFEDCVREGEASGNLAFDAQIAAVCLEHGARDLWTFDRDFSRFPGLRPTSKLS